MGIASGSPLMYSNPDITMTNTGIPDTSVDWERTDRYSDAVRAKRYGETRGESDFAMLSARVTEALNQIALTSDPARRLAMAVEARGNLARWPFQNFGYRAADVSQLVSMLDEDKRMEQRRARDGDEAALHRRPVCLVNAWCHSENGFTC